MAEHFAAGFPIWQGMGDLVGRGLFHRPAEDAEFFVEGGVAIGADLSVRGVYDDKSEGGGDVGSGGRADDVAADAVVLPVREEDARFGKFGVVFGDGVVFEDDVLGMPEDGDAAIVLPQ